MINTEHNFPSDNNILSTSDLLIKFKKSYPDIDFNTIQTELFENMFINFINNELDESNELDDSNEFNNLFDKINGLNINTNINTNTNTNINTNTNTNINTNTNSNIKYEEDNKMLIEQNYLMANELIPEMFFPTNLIKFNGKINNSNVKIMLDTGASCCVIYKSIIDKNNLNYLIDTESKTLVQGAHSTKSTVGTIWYLEIDLEVDNGNFVSVPITANVIDDTDNINSQKIIDEYYNKMSKKKNILSDNSESFQIILGMTFLKSYRVKIDFSSMYVTLNNNIKIKFK